MKRRFGLLAALLVFGLLSRGGQASALAPGSQIPWQGASAFLLGANLPWYNYGADFGGGSNGGASSPTVQAALIPALAQAQAAGMHTIRWWVLEGDPSKSNSGAPPQITTDAAGTPTGISPNVYTDLVAALRLAATFDLNFDFVLFSSPTSIPTGWLTDSTQQGALASVLGELFAHYAGNPHILSWEVFNEPEWDIQSGKIGQAPVQATVRAIAAAVHANSTAYVTVGSAQLHDLGMWVGQGLDYYQAHWYDPMTGPDVALNVTYSDAQRTYGLDAPLVIGEFYTTTTDSTALSRLTTLYTNGYAGAWPWSLFPDHTQDHLAIDFPAAQVFAAQAPGPAVASPSAPSPATAGVGPILAQPTVGAPQPGSAPTLPQPAGTPVAPAPSQTPIPPASPTDPTARASPFNGPQPLATAQCNDGWFSYAQSPALTCIGHGGVMAWIAQPGTAGGVVALRTQQSQRDPSHSSCPSALGPSEFSAPCASSSGACPQPMGAVVLVICGTGDHSSSTFSVPADWDLAWSFENCSGGSGNFIVNVYNSDGSPSVDNQGVNQLSSGGSSAEHCHTGGSFFLKVLSECSCTIEAISRSA